MYRQRVPNFMNSNRTPQNSTVNGDNNVDKSKVETCGDNAIWWDRPEITQWKNTGVGHRRVLYYENQQRVTPEAVYSRQQMQTAIQFTTNAAYMTSKLDPILALRTVNPYWNSWELTKVEGLYTGHMQTTMHECSSFETWPLSLKPRAKELVEAGFFYTGKSDQTLCFNCGCGLRNWEPTNEPWIGNAKWSSQCSFVVMNKGKDFLQKAISKEQPLLQPEDIKNVMKQILKSVNSWQVAINFYFIIILLQNYHRHLGKIYNLYLKIINHHLIKLIFFTLKLNQDLNEIKKRKSKILPYILLYKNSKFGQNSSSENIIFPDDSVGLKMPKTPRPESLDTLDFIPP